MDPSVRFQDASREAAFFRETLIASPTPILVVERRAHAWSIVYVNPAFERRMGYRRDQIIDCDWRVLCGEAGTVAPDLVQAAMDRGHEMLTTLRTRTRGGRDSWSEIRIAPVSGEATIARCVLLLRDVTEEKAQREQLLQRALHDGLTGLANRQSFDERLMNAIARASSSGRPLAVAMLDLDGFKGVNDSHGHAAGDQLLQVIGQRLGNELRIGDAVARLGGDEFGVLLESVRTHDEMADIFDRLVAAIESPVSIGGLTLQVGCSIGIGWYPWHGADGAALLHHADAAMYAAKSRKPSPGNDRGSPRGREAEEARMATA